MIQRSLLLFTILVTKGLLFGQNMTGKWYEIESPNASLEITIDKNNNTYSGTFSWEWNNWISTVNAPLDHVLIKNDSLFLALTHANNTVNCKLQWKDHTKTYEGFDMPLRIFVNQKATWIYPKTDWTQQYFDETINQITIDPNFYVGELKYTNLRKATEKD